MNSEKLNYSLREIKSKLLPTELAQYCEDINTCTNSENRKFILKLWRDLVVCKEGTEPEYIKQKKYLNIMENLHQLRNSVPKNTQQIRY